MRFSEWLKTYRKAAKISQDILAEKVSALGFEISGAQISNYEREYDKDQDGNPTRPKEKFVELAALILNRPINEARRAAGFASTESSDSDNSYEIIEGATVSFDERKFTKAEQERLFAAMRMLALGAKADTENE